MHGLNLRFDDKNNHMPNSGPPQSFPPGARERRSRWDPVPKQGIFEKNFYVMHPEVAQRQEVCSRFLCMLVEGLYLECSQMSCDIG